MRNLLQYPVTQEEILKSLQLEKLTIEQQQLIGDMRPLILRHTIEILEAAFALLKGFDRRADERGMGFVIPFPEATALIKACDFEIKPSALSSPLRCEGCDQNYADPPSKLCPGCQAYQEHQR